ncbi:MAG TPA: hypothetical protein VL974_14140, partial [Magnetospirillum sp.]|nr:hypothetical protein [Magnetospirillum sp.]
MGAARNFSSGLDWAGEFLDSSLERPFAEALRGIANAQARLSIVVTSLTCLAFVPFDLQTLHDGQLAFFLSCRAIVAVNMIAVLMILARTSDVDRIVRISQAGLYAFFTVNALVFNHPALQKQGLGIFPLIAVGMWLIIPGRIRGVAALTLYASAISIGLWSTLGEFQPNPKDVGIVILETIAAYAVGCGVRMQTGRMRRDNFLHLMRER